MADAHFDLNERLQVLRMAGLRHVLQLERPQEAPDWLAQEPWPAILSKAPASARLAWTYHDLGLDLTGAPNRDRGQLWRRIIGLLGLPPGSVAFLPHALPVGGEMVMRPRHFQSALERCMVRGLVVFTQLSRAAFFRQVFGNEEPSLGSIALFIAPDPAHLLSLDEASLADALSPLQQWCASSA